MSTRTTRDLSAPFELARFSHGDRVLADGWYAPTPGRRYDCHLRRRTTGRHLVLAHRPTEEAVWEPQLTWPSAASREDAARLVWAAFEETTS